MSDEESWAMNQLSPERARELFERFVELLNEHDVRHVPKIWTEDIEFDDPAVPEVMTSHADVERFFTMLWRAMPDLRFQLLEGPYLSEDGRHVAVRLGMSGTMTGPLDPPGFAPTDTPMTTEFAGFYELEGERIKRQKVIGNMNDVGIQIGAAPAPGTAGERFGVFMQRLTARRMRRQAKA